MYSDTSKHSTGSVLFQVQDGKPKLIAYVSKRMPGAAKNYSITELETRGLAINITSFTHLLKRVDFDAIVDHLAIMHIMKSKMEPTTNRIKRLLELLSSYFFNLYYIKGKDMVLSDFLSSPQGDDSDPHKIIPISFNIKEMLKQNYCTYVEDKFMVQSRSKNKARGVKLPAVHGTKKTLVLHDIPEKQPASTIKCRQGKITIKRKVKLPPNETLGPVEPKQTNFDTQPQDVMTTSKQEIDQIPPYVCPIHRPPPRPPDLGINNGTNIRPELITDHNKDFEENSPCQEGIISEIYESPDQSYIRKPHKLADLVDTSQIVQKYLPKQTDIDKILDIIKRKVLKGTHLPLTIEEIQAGYLSSPYFKDLYRYLAQNKLPSKRSVICKVETLAER